ncbi:MAG: AAA family ATPase [Treponema sp.]|nr:AAA family ATPase [Treponema sp.]
MNKDRNIELTADSFFETLKELKGISPLWEKVTDSLKYIQDGMTAEAESFFIMYFSLLDDGNICIPLEADSLCKKFSSKWKGLLLAEDCTANQEECNSFFHQQAEKAISQIKNGDFPNLINNFKEGFPSEQTYSKPFVRDNDWLFASKYHKAKKSIEKHIKNLFIHREVTASESEKEQLKEYFKSITKALPSGNPMELKERQLEAIIRGQKENLIITGGPGTGKTTVVCYLLWELLKKEEYQDYSIHLAAPSGKAAERMKESISNTLSQIKEKDFSKLNSLQSHTIHSLLGYNPAQNGFMHNREVQFEEKSIFVIDEASMIDISLFAALIESINEKSRIFILGDKDQLPSVKAGAVLGELLAKKTDSVVALNESNRFNDNSEVGRLKDAFQSEKPLDFSLLNITEKDKLVFEIPENRKEYPVKTVIPGKADDELILDWSRKFYDDLSENCIINQESDLDSLWKKALSAKILCAERKGPHGVEYINQLINKHIMNKYDFSAAEEYFPGQLLMLTKNHNMFNLYNGDSGIVVSVKKEGLPLSETESFNYLMIKKDLKTGGDEEGIKGGIFRIGNYLFYPLYILPKESIETAYAITIHKAQGSGYKAILIFLPSKEGHPLLNRQIAYTAITRTEGSTYIAARAETLEEARRTIITRDTMIQF